MSERDYGAEDFAWPDVRELRPADAARLLDDIEREASLANKRADRLKSRKAQAKAIVNAVIEDYDQNSVDFTNADGKRVRYTPYPFDVFSIDNPEEFKLWSMTQSESYYDSTPRLREGILLDEMRRRVQDKEPLPPGVRRYTDTRLSRSAVAGK